MWAYVSDVTHVAFLVWFYTPNARRLHFRYGVKKCVYQLVMHSFFWNTDRTQYSTQFCQLAQ